MQPSAPRRVERLLINLDTTLPSICAWADCDKQARTPYQVRIHEHVGKCSDVALTGGRHSHFTFCSDHCMDYWVWSSGWRAHETAARNNGRIWGMAPPGSKIGRFR
jgi:hypothetical protein